MKKCVTINSCSDENLWYKDEIGESYEYKFDDGDDSVVIDICDGKGSLGSVFIKDVDIFDVEDDVIIRSSKIPLTENEILKEELNAVSKTIYDSI